MIYVFFHDAFTSKRSTAHLTQYLITNPTINEMNALFDIFLTNEQSYFLLKNSIKFYENEL